MKVTPETKYDRIKYLLLNNFVFKPNYEYQHKSECIMVKLDLIENASYDEWNRLTDNIEYFINKHNF